MTIDDAKRIAEQLRQPSGAEAPEVARRMNEANRSANQRCIALLQLKAGERLLEIGPGNGAFAGDIVAAADRVHYTGLDWSAAMVTAAQRDNASLLTEGRARFLQGSSDRMPFASASFDKVMAVHTLYFWERAQDHLLEIRRVMTAGGLPCIAFGDRSFMKDLPFVSFGFALYDGDDA